MFMNKTNMSTYFDSFVISSFLGTTKPDEKMYITALKELNVKPDETVFIDDNLKNCKGAINVGINAILLCRNQTGIHHRENQKYRKRIYRNKQFIST